MIHTTPPVHLRLGVALERKTEKLALRAVLTASRLLGVATGTHLRHLREVRRFLISRIRNRAAGVK